MTTDPPFAQLHQLVQDLAPMPAAGFQRLKEAFSVLELPRKIKLTEVGKVAHALYFVNKGLVRLYYEKDGTDITAFIFREGYFAASYESFLRQQPSNQCLETLEEVELLALSHQALECLYVELPELHILTRKVAEQRFINAQRILSSHILESPEERYRRFLEENGDLLLRVPHHMVASFLGITPVSLSRIRKRIR